MNTLTTSNNKSVNILAKVYESRFHQAALWGAITFVRIMSDSSVHVKDVIQQYQSYMGLDEDSLDSDSAYMSYFRLNKMVIQAHKQIRDSSPGQGMPPVCNPEIINEMREQYSQQLDLQNQQFEEFLNELAEKCQKNEDSNSNRKIK